MPKLTLGTNVTVLILFFGISLLDGMRSHDWLRALLWFAIGLVSLRADSLKAVDADRVSIGRAT
jgi:galactitol-specific phosphotransferase system IIC component